MVIMKWRLQKRKSWLTPWLLGISSVLPYLHGNYSRLSIKGTYVSYHTICQCRWLRFLLEQRAVLSLDGVLAEIHFWPHQICIWAGFFFFFLQVFDSLTEFIVHFSLWKKSCWPWWKYAGYICIWKSDINRNKAPTENELGHMPRHPDAVASGPGHWAEYGLAGPRTSHVSHTCV